LNIPIIIGASVIRDNLLGQIVASRYHAFPFFQSGHGFASVIGNNYLFKIYEQFEEPIRAGHLYISRSNPTQFSPSLNHFIFTSIIDDFVFEDNWHFDIIQAFQDSSFVSAEELIKDVILLHPSSSLAKTAIGYLPILLNMSGGDVDEMIAFVESIDHPNLNYLKTETLALINMFYSRYNDAIDMFEVIIQGMPCQYNYISITCVGKECGRF